MCFNLFKSSFLLLSKPPNKSFYLCSRGSFLRKFYANFEKKGLGGNGCGTYMYHYAYSTKGAGTNLYQQTYAGKRIYLQSENLLAYYLK